MRTPRAFIATIGLVAGLTNFCFAAGYYVTDLGAGNQPAAINSSGEIAGGNISSSIPQAFWYDGTVHYLTSPGDTGLNGGAALGINDLGQVVGYTEQMLGTDTESQAFLYDGTMHLLAPMNSQANAINNNGQIVGRTASGPFLYDGSLHDLTPVLGFIANPHAINDNGQFVGYWAAGTTVHGFISNGTTATDLGTLGGATSFAFGVNASGKVVGDSYVSSSSGAINPFVYDGTMHDLGTFGGTQGIGYGINDKGQIVGESRVSPSSTLTHAFLYQGGHLIDLNSLISATLGWVMNSAYAINKSGQIVGLGTLNGQTKEGFLLTPVISGDVNADGIVNSQDLALMSSAWLQTGSGFAPIPQADANGDGIVNSQDIALVSSNWLASAHLGHSAAVPEPNSIALLTIAAVGLLGVAHGVKRSPR